MKKFNLQKRASSDDYTIHDKMLDENRKNMNLSNNQQGVVEKNINLSLPIKNKDNTIPFNKQLEAERKNETSFAITEASMDKKEVTSDSKDKKQVMDINVKTEEYNQKHLDAFKKAENDSKKDTTFWDKYVGVQLEGEGQPIKIKNNISNSSSQLSNQPSRFKNKEVSKMVMASLKDADAMLFHIYSIACKEGRNLSSEEKQQITDINSGKTRLIAQYGDNSTLMPTQIFDGDVFIIPNKYGKWLVYETGGGGEPIDEFDSAKEALTNYPEGEIRNA